MYLFYLEDAVYRDIVLWDLLRQCLNEFFQCGFKIEDEINIFSFLNDYTVKKSIGNYNVVTFKKIEIRLKELLIRRFEISFVGIREECVREQKIAFRRNVEVPAYKIGTLKEQEKGLLQNRESTIE